MRVTRTPHLTQRVNRFVQELFAACNEDGANFVLNDEEAYTRPIDLQEYVIPYSHSARNTPLPIMPIPQRIRLSKKIGGTVYDVTANFNMEGKETILQQFKALILSAEL